LAEVNRSLALSVAGLGVRYGGFAAVSDLNIEVPQGEVRALIGPNGAGKTTSFNAICGYVRPSAGTVTVQGQRLKSYNPRAAWKAGIGRTFQRAELFWTLEVRDHLELAHRHAVKRGLTPPTVDSTLELLNLTRLQHDLVANLPIGICRQVELARAISTGANLILMDEPCSGLDRHETEQLDAALRRIQAELELSLLIVEHDIEFILSIAGWVFVLDHGSLIAEGSPSAIRNDPLVRQAYLGGMSTSGPNHDLSTTTPVEA